MAACVCNHICNRICNRICNHRYGGVGAGVSCACVSEHELLVGTQEGNVIAYGLDPAQLHGAAVRDVAAWAAA